MRTEVVDMVEAQGVRLTLLEEANAASKLAAQAARITSLEKKSPLKFGDTTPAWLLPKLAHLPSMPVTTGESTSATDSGMLPASASQQLAITPIGHRPQPPKLGGEAVRVPRFHKLEFPIYDGKEDPLGWLNYFLASAPWRRGRFG